MENKIKPEFFEKDQWTLTNAGFGGDLLSPLDSTVLTIHTLVKVGKWGEHTIVRHLYCFPDTSKDTLVFSFADFEDDHFFDFENLHGDDDLFKKLQSELFSTWEKEADMAVKYTDGHINIAASLFAAQVLGNPWSVPGSFGMKNFIKTACKEHRFDYVDVLSHNRSEIEV